MRSFFQAHNPTNFDVHSLSTLENHIFKFSLPLKVIFSDTDLWETLRDFTLKTQNLQKQNVVCGR